MKTKEKEIQKKIKELCELMGKDDIFVIFRKNGNVVDIALPHESNVDDHHVSAALASVIEAHFIEKGNEGVDRLSEIIVNSIEALIGVSPLAGAKLETRFVKAALLGMKIALGRLSNDDGEDEDEDCENCEFLKKCDNDAAIKYRKEHHIPRPKKGKNGGRKVDVN